MSHKTDRGLFPEVKITPGENYHAVWQEIISGELFFVLAEKREIRFPASAFLICSDLDETLLINHQIKRRK